MARYSRIGQDLSCKDLDTVRRTIVPNYRGGALRIKKEMNLPMNVAYQRMGHPKVMQQFVNRYLNQGGVSLLFGHRAKPGFILDHLLVPLYDDKGCFLLDSTI